MTKPESAPTEPHYSGSQPPCATANPSTGAQYLHRWRQGCASSGTTGGPRDPAAGCHAAGGHWPPHGQSPGAARAGSSGSSARSQLPVGAACSAALCRSAGADAVPLARPPLASPASLSQESRNGLPRAPAGSAGGGTWGPGVAPSPHAGQTFPTCPPGGAVGAPGPAAPASAGSGPPETLAGRKGEAKSPSPNSSCPLPGHLGLRASHGPGAPDPPREALRPRAGPKGVGSGVGSAYLNKSKSCFFL